MCKRDADADITRYPAEADEPHHTKLYGDENFLVYRAVIPPGEETLYHSHADDALVVAARGGAQANSVVGPSRADRFVFPSPAGLARKLGAGLSGLLTGSIRFRTGAFFATLYTGHPIVHKIAAAPKNAAALEFLDIQVLSSGGSAPFVPPVPPRGARRRLRTDGFVVYTARALPGAGALEFRPGGPALVLSLDGRLRAGGLPHSGVDHSADLDAGGFLAVKGGERIELACASDRAVRVLFLMPRPAEKGRDA